MSFSSDVKDELAHFMAGARHCRIAELSAMTSMSGHVRCDDGRYSILFSTENGATARKYYELIKDIFSITPRVQVRSGQGQRKTLYYSVSVENPEEARVVLMTTKLMSATEGPREDLMPQTGVALRSDCCKRSFIRGAFLTSGSISDPEKFYHLEIVNNSMDKASFVRDLLVSFGFDARIVQRKRYYIVYIKEGEQIVDLLNIMMAHRSLLNLENVRVLKEVRNQVNRKVNCETANLNRTVFASVKQVEDINFIKDTVGLDYLKEGLMEVALLRLDNPDTSLKELGTKLNPPVGKSGVNHRLKKISEIAEDLRQTKI